MQSRFGKIHMKITNFICKCTTGQNCLLVLYALWVCRFCLNFYRLSMHLNFWYKVYLMMHYGCASFEFFLNIPTMFFHRVFTFSPRRWFALNILPNFIPSLLFPSHLRSNLPLHFLCASIHQRLARVPTSATQKCYFFFCTEGNSKISMTLRKAIKIFIASREFTPPLRL